jgi:hypothetical protein
LCHLLREFFDEVSCQCTFLQFCEGSDGAGEAREAVVGHDEPADSLRENLFVKGFDLIAFKPYHIKVFAPFERGDDGKAVVGEECDL